MTDTTRQHTRCIDTFLVVKTHCPWRHRKSQLPQSSGSLSSPNYLSGCGSPYLFSGFVVLWEKTGRTRTRCTRRTRHPQPTKFVWRATTVANARGTAGQRQKGHQVGFRGEKRELRQACYLRGTKYIVRIVRKPTLSCDVAVIVVGEITP